MVYNKINKKGLLLWLKNQQKETTLDLVGLSA